MLSSTLLSLALYGVTNAKNSLEFQSPVSLGHSVNSLCHRLDIFADSCYAHQLCLHDYEDPFNNSLTLTTEPQPWTNPPTCTTTPNITTELCAFTYKSLYNDRGISLLTTSSIARTIARLPAFSIAANYTPPSLSENDVREPPYEIRELPGRGMGVIAARRIERGELLFAHAAVAIYLNDGVDKASTHYNTHHAPLVAATVENLPSSTREKFLAMAAHDEEGEPVIERIYTNTFSETFGGEEHSIVVPETARMNHDCRPNSMYHFDKKTLMHYTHAARVIEGGEEITITYIDPLQTRLVRRKAIKHSWGFDCTCSLCSLSYNFVHESNRRIAKIVELNQIFEESSSVDRAVTGSPEMAELLVSLYEQERLYSTVADGYRYAALAYAAKGRAWEAMKWAMKAVEWGLIFDGSEEESVVDMMGLLEGVQRHWSWGVNFEDDDERESE